MQVGDYVICAYKYTYDSSNNIKNLANFIKNNIGIIIKYDDQDILIKYDNVPDNIKMFFNGKDLNIRSLIDTKSILAFGKTIEELEIKLAANKYNL